MRRTVLFAAAALLASFVVVGDASACLCHKKKAACAPVVYECAPAPTCAPVKKHCFAMPKMRMPKFGGFCHKQTACPVVESGCRPCGETLVAQEGEWAAPQSNWAASQSNWAAPQGQHLPVPQK